MIRESPSGLSFIIYRVGRRISRVGISHNVLIIKQMRVVVSPISGLDVHFLIDQYCLSLGDKYSINSPKTCYMLQNITLKVYAHMIYPMNNDSKVTTQHFQAIDIADKTAHMIAEMCGGVADCSTCGTVQYADRVFINKISENSLDLILTIFPFVKKAY